MASKKLLAVAGGLAAVVAVIGAIVVLTAQTTPGKADTKAATFTMRGSIRIDNAGPGTPFSNDGVACRGAGGYSDITPGAAVIVQDPKGQTVATGALQVGYPATTTMSVPALGIKPAAFVASCSLSFAVPNVPVGLDSYSVTVSHRGTQVVRGAAVRDDVDLVLNSTK